MSHVKLIKEITPFDTNSRLKSEAVKGHYDQAQLARLADVNNLGEQVDGYLNGVITNYDFSSVEYFLHKSGERANLGGQEFEGYYIAFPFSNDASSANLKEEIARITVDTPVSLKVATQSVIGTVATLDNSTPPSNYVSSFATGALATDQTTGGLVPLTKCLIYWSSEDPTSPGTELDNLFRLFVDIDQAGGNDIDVNGFVRVDFLVPVGATVTVTAP